LMMVLRRRTNKSRVLKTIERDCCSADLTGTNRIVGRTDASAISSASFASFFRRFTNGFT
jgi:hypothetical protein